MEQRPASETFLIKTDALKRDLQMSTLETILTSSSKGQQSPMTSRISSVQMNLRSRTTKRLKVESVAIQKRWGMPLSRSHLRKTVMLGCVST